MKVLKLLRPVARFGQNLKVSIKKSYGCVSSSQISAWRKHKAFEIFLQVFLKRYCELRSDETVVLSSTKTDLL